MNTEQNQVRDGRDARPTALVIGALLAALFALPLRAADEIPGAPQAQPIALVGGTVHTVSGKTIENGTVVFEDGKITFVGKNPQLIKPTKMINVKGKHVYPGLIDAYTDLGLIEINAVRATRDQAETGEINPSARAEVAVNPDSELIPVARSNGILVALTAPTGGYISGTSALIELDGWTWEDMTVATPVGLHIDWPRMTPTALRDSSSYKQQIERRDNALEAIEKTFTDARAYVAALKAHEAGQAEAPKYDARWRAMQPILAGKTPIIVEADELGDIQAAVAFAARQKVKLIIFGGYDAPLCASLLKEHDVPVIVAGTHRLPERRHDDYDAAYTLPDRLRKAGVKYCISGSYRFGASMVRNLPFHAGAAAAHGLPKAEALRSVTLYPAQLLGVGDELGSLEKGKHATLIVTDGDPLEISTHVIRAFIQGREVDLSNKHKRLWRKYELKYERQKSGADTKP